MRRKIRLMLPPLPRRRLILLLTAMSILPMRIAKSGELRKKMMPLMILLMMPRRLNLIRKPLQLSKKLPTKPPQMLQPLPKSTKSKKHKIERPSRSRVKLLKLKPPTRRPKKS